MMPSEIMQVTGGTSGAALESLERRLEKGAKHVLEVDLERESMSWAESASEGGMPSGMVSNLKSGRSLHSLFTNVM